MTVLDLAHRHQEGSDTSFKYHNSPTNDHSHSQAIPTSTKKCVHSSASNQYPSSPSQSRVSTPLRTTQRPMNVYHSPSVSASDSTIMTPVSSIDLEKAEAKRKQELDHSLHHTTQTPRDPEKAYRMPHCQSRRAGDADAGISYSEPDEIDHAVLLQQEKALRVLLWLALPNVILAMLHTAWACVSLLVTLLTQPVRLCAKRPSFGQQLDGLLGPSLNMALRCIYTPLPPHANEDGSYHTAWLFLVHIFSPFVSFAVLLAAWTLAVYWASSSIVGDPAGQDKRDDGKEAVLWLRQKWERWLMRCIADDS